MNNVHACASLTCTYIYIYTDGGGIYGVTAAKFTPGHCTVGSTVHAAASFHYRVLMHQADPRAAINIAVTL